MRNKKRDVPQNSKGNREQEKPQVFAIRKDGEGFRISRRNFLGMAGITAAGTASFITTGCAGSRKSNLMCDGKCGDFEAHKELVSCFSMSPEGKILASGSFDNAIKLWSLPDGKLLQVLAAQKEGKGVTCLFISRDGKTLAAEHLDGTIELWALPEGTLLRTLEGHGYGGSDLFITPDGKILATGSDDATIKLWSLPDGVVLKTLEGHVNRVSGTSITPDGKILISHGSNTFYSIPYTTADGKTAYSSTEDHSIKIWSLPDGNLLKTLEGHTGPVFAFSISPDGKILASGSGDATIKLWSLPEGILLKTIKGNTNGITALSFKPDGKVLASATEFNDHEIKLWSIPDGHLLKTIKGNKERTDGVNAISFSLDGKILVSSGFDHAIKFWSLPEGALLTCLYDPECMNSANAITYRKMGFETITLPCGFPIPPGAQCICNCVAGSVTYPGTRTVCVCDTITVPTGQALPAGTVCVCNTVAIGNIMPQGHTRQMTGTVCSCNTICTCDSVCTCQSICSCQSVGGGGHYWYPN
jgi:hypothetical protein